MADLHIRPSPAMEDAVGPERLRLALAQLCRARPIAFRENWLICSAIDDALVALASELERVDAGPGEAVAATVTAKF